MEDVERGEIERGVIVVREDTNHGNCGSRIKAVA
jgi:hypothetical protein